MRWLPGSLATTSRQPFGTLGVDPSSPFGRGFVFVGSSSLEAVSKTQPQTITSSRVSRRPAFNGVGTYINDAGGAGSNLSYGPSRAFCMSGATRGTWVVQFVLDNTTDSPHLFGSWNIPSTNHWLIQVNTTGLIWIPADEGVSNRRRWDGTGLFTAGRLHTLVLVWNGGASYVAFLDGREITLSAVDTTANSIRPSPSFIHVGNYLSGAANRFNTLLAACTPVAVPRSVAQKYSMNPWDIISVPGRPLFVPTPVATVYRPGSDITANGWTATPSGSLFERINESTLDTGDYITSPNLTNAVTLGWDVSVPTGTNTIRVNARYLSTTGQLRVVMLDSGGSSVGNTAWQALTATDTTYELTVTTTGISTQFRIEVQ